MRIIDKNNFEQLRTQKNIVILGNFDGIHKGHQELIKRGIECTKECDCKTILYTFKSHSDQDVKLLTNNHEKIEILKNYSSKKGILCDIVELYTQIQFYGG